MHEGPVSAALGLAGIPSVSESTMIARDAALAGLRGRQDPRPAPLRRRVGRRGARGASSAGVQISAEASPHHLCLTDEEVRSLDPRRFKMNPPLRPRPTARRSSRRSATARSSASPPTTRPTPPRKRRCPSSGAAMGVTGLETAFAALHTELVLAGEIDLALLVERLAGGAAPFGVERPTLAPGERGQRRALRPRRRVDGRRGRLREPLARTPGAPGAR